MFKFLTLFLGKLFFKSPIVHNFSPKLVNVNFSNSKIVNPVILNLTNILSIEFYTNLIKGSDIPDEYALMALIDGDRELQIGLFESKKEAEEALILLNIKISSLSKFFAKWIMIIIVFLMLLMVSKDMLTLWSLSQNVVQNRVSQMDSPKVISKTEKPENKIPEVSGAVGQVNPAPNNPVLSDEELMTLFKEAQKISDSQGGTNINPENTVQPSVNQEGNQQPQNLSPTDSFIQGLK